MNRKICVVTGTRADYGLLRWLMQGLRESSGIELQVVATGMHLSPEFGLTFRAIEQDGFTINAKVEMLVSSDTDVGLTKSVGLGTIGFADVYGRLAPDMVVVLGDRFEILAAAQAAFFAGICIAHISGGEVTEGALDDAIRHSITKMARYHFVAADAYRNRVIQLGEAPESVFNVGDPGLDNIARLPMLNRSELEAALGLALDAPFLLVTHHPTTTGASAPAESMRTLLDALDAFPDIRVIITKSNADAGGRIMNQMVDKYADRNRSRVTAVTSLGQLNYLSAMKHCAAVVGNSSSGIVEAPALGIPTVNVGNRQQGRLKATSVIDCVESGASIAKAIDRALSPEFRNVAARTLSLYGNCNASRRILEIIVLSDTTPRFAKRFHDLRA